MVIKIKMITLIKIFKIYYVKEIFTMRTVIRNFIYGIGILSVLLGCQTGTKTAQVEEVASFNGQQVTGVSVSDKGRIFVSFPQWRLGVANSVLEVNADKTQVPFPNKAWNIPPNPATIEPESNLFLAVQSLLALDDELYVLDTRNPWFRGVIDSPRVFVFDLNTKALKKVYKFQQGSFYQQSYINDLRIDKQNGKAYFTDSSRAGLVVLDLKTGATKRVLDNHYSTLADLEYLSIIDSSPFGVKIHADGIALDLKNDKLYFHALSSYNLYSIPTKVLNEGSEAQIQDAVTLELRTSATDGMILDRKGNLYVGDLEVHRIVRMTPDKKLETLIGGDGTNGVSWADTFSIYDEYLYFTNSRIHQIAPDTDVSQMTFTLNRIYIGD